MSVLATSQAQESYITIHALNPEGVEIASIEGMDPYCVEVFDGENLIGYAPYDAETHNIPITIEPGAHTIKAVFNGITNSQNIVLDAGETREVTFRFKRTEFDILSKIISAFSDSYRLTFSRTFDNEYNLVDNISNPTKLGRFYLAQYVQYQGTGSINVNMVFDFNGHSYLRSYDSHLFLTGEPYDRGDSLLAPYIFCTFLYYYELWDGGNGHYKEPNVVPPYTDFSYWYVQSITSADYPYFGLLNDAGKGGLIIPAYKAGYNIRSVQANISYDRLFGRGISICTPWLKIGEDFVEMREDTAWEESGELSRLLMSSVPLDFTGMGIHCGGGGPQPPECSFSAENPVWVDEADGMVLPYDEVELKFEFTNTAPNPLSNVSVGFLRNSELISLKGIEEIGTVPPGETFTATNIMKIAGTDDSTIMDEIIKTTGSGKLSLEDAIKVMVTADECLASCEFILSPRDDKGEILSIQYPDFWNLVGTPYLRDSEEDLSYYLRGGGDSDFHNPQDNNVRKCAVEAAVYDDSVFPDNIPEVVVNMYSYIDDILGDRDCSGQGANCVSRLDIDKNIADRINNGEVNPHPGEDAPKDEYHICISQAYLLGSLSRAVGIPSREMDIALGNNLVPIGENKYRILYGRQEAAVQMWYSNDWENLYDTFLETTSFDTYLGSFLGYRAWYSFDRQSSQLFEELPWRGHNFRLEWLTWTGIPMADYQWKLFKEKTQEGLAVQVGSPVYMCLSDGQGNMTGNIGGNTVEEIPDSWYTLPGTLISYNRADPRDFREAKETIFVGGITEPVDYSLSITGTDDGYYELILAYIHHDGEIDGSTIPLDIRRDETHTYDITVSPSGEISVTGVPARINVDPDTMNLDAPARWITCYIELPDGFDVSLINGETVQLDGIPAYIGKENWAKAESNQWNITDHDGDSIPERMVKFDSLAIQLLFLAPGDATLTLYGELTDGTVFEGADNIRIIKPRTK
jgi:hypothetical protein